MGVGCCGGLCCCAVSAGASGASSDGVDVEAEVRGGLGPGVPLIVVIDEDRLPLTGFLGEPLITRQRRVTTNRVSTQTSSLGDLADGFPFTINSFWCSIRHDRKSSILFSVF